MEIKEYGCTRSDSDEDIYEDTPEVSRSHGAPHPILHRASPEKLDQARARKSLSARKSASKSRSRSSKAEIASKHKKVYMMFSCSFFSFGSFFIFLSRDKSSTCSYAFPLINDLSSLFFFFPLSSLPFPFSYVSLFSHFVSNFLFH